MLTDFFITNLDEAMSINKYSDIEKFQVLYAKNVDTIKLSTLDEILTGEEIDFEEPIKELESGEAWIFLVRKKLVEILASLSINDLSVTASKWSKTDEWVLDNGNETDLFDFLQELKKLIIQPKNDKQDLFLIISL